MILKIYIREKEGFMKRFSNTILKFLLILIIGEMFSGCSRERFLEKRFTKNAKENAGPIPDYSQVSNWAASPYKHNTSDSIPAFLSGEKRDTSVDVFFIHPTSYKLDIKEASWNADVSDSELNAQTDSRSILFQASAFNQSCRIFAPRYRQAHLKAFIIKNSKPAKEALDLAYSDIKRAFKYYMDHENHGRPIIIASHSQGSHHAVRLLQEFFDGTPLQKQLVCAYVVGWPFDIRSFKFLHVGNSPDAVGCVVGWCTFQDGEEPRFLRIDSGTAVCVNPLSWTTVTDEASSDLHLGAVFHDFNMIYLHIVSARIDPEDHILWVSIPEQMNEKLSSTRNLHVIDYNLFWMNIRENVKTRIKAYFKNRK